MNRTAVFILSFFLFLPVLAQGPGPALSLDEDPPGPRPFPSATNLLASIGSGSNYFSYLPTGGVNFELEHPGDGSSAFKLVYVRKNGMRQSRTINLGRGEKTQVKGDPLAADDEIYVLSMQPFSLTTASPIHSTGSSSRQVRVHTPANPLLLKSVTTFSKTTISVGVDSDGLCHYPIHGEIIGQILEDGNIKLHRDGAILEADPM